MKLYGYPIIIQFDLSNNFKAVCKNIEVTELIKDIQKLEEK